VDEVTRDSLRHEEPDGHDKTLSYSYRIPVPCDSTFFIFADTLNKLATEIFLSIGFTFSSWIHVPVTRDTAREAYSNPVEVFRF